VAAPYEVQLALRYLRFHRGRTFLSIITLISVAGVTVGTAALVIALALMTGFQEDVRERILGGSAHLNILGNTGATIPASDALAARVAELPGVQAASPVLHTPAMITAETALEPAYAEIEGVRADHHAQVLSSVWNAADPFEPLVKAPVEEVPPILLGEGLARRLSVSRGDRVRLLVPRVTLTPFAPLPRTRLFRVAGTFRSDTFEQDAQRAYVKIEDARRLLDAGDGASWIEARLTSLRELDDAKQTLRKSLGPEWTVVDVLEQNQAMLKALNTEKLILFLAIALIVVVASLNIVSTLILMVADKMKEIGTLTAMGARPAGIASIFVLQGAVIGVVGAFLGLLLGVGAATWLDHYRMIPLNPEVYYLDHVPFAPRGSDLVFVGCLSLVVSLLATIYPALRAARQDPVEAIRRD